MPARRLHARLLLAGAPAVAGSLAVMWLAEVPSALLAQQAGAATVAAVVAVMLARRTTPGATAPRWLVPLLAAALFVPIAIGSGPGPQRWVGAAGVRLYLAPLILPVFLRLAPGSASGVAALIVAGVGLLVQPDAAQATATACAAVALGWATRRAAGLRLGVLAALGACAVAAWRRPDPLAPVPHVEGVFLVAASAGAAALTAAWAAAALPVVTLGWLGVSARDPGLLAPALYYAALLAQAPLLVTPVPLLGYGVAPILGYAAMTALSATPAGDHGAATSPPGRSGG